MSAHSPGPWEVRFFRSKSHRIDAPGWDELAVVYGNEDDDLDRRGRANARRIAAAPELLAELKALHFDCGVSGCSACAAIAKAEGKS